MIFLTETKCKIRFIYVGVNSKRKKNGVKKCLEESKAFQRAKPTRVITLLFHLRERIVTERPFTQESFVTKSLRVKRRNTFPMVREGDT